jgi:signal transduction histidine kinase
MVELASVPRRIPRIDMLLAAGLMIWALLESFLSDPSSPVALGIVWSAGFSLPLLWRRRWPVQMLAVIAATTLWRAAAGEIPSEGAMPMPCVLVGAFSAALYARPKWIAPLGIVLPVIAIAFGVPHDDTAVVDYAILTFIISVTWLSGWLLRRRAEQLEAAHAAAPEIARDAVLAERERMARELHDVVAHSVSIISVQAGAAEQQLERDPDRAREHLAAVRGSAHEALSELRRMVGLLREEDASYVPAPGLSRLEDLVETTRSSGQPVSLNVSGEARALPPGVDLAAYRVIQEGLTNARKHASNAATSVGVEYGERALEIQIENGPGTGSETRFEGDGRGLIGMRERVRLYDGTLDAGPTDEGGFAVRANLPYGDVVR